MRVGRAGNAVDDVIRLIVKPLAVVNHVVRHLRTGQKRESADNLARFIRHDMASARFDVLTEHVVARIAVGPLEGVAIAAHDFTRLVAEVQNRRQVLHRGVANHIARKEALHHRVEGPVAFVGKKMVAFENGQLCIRQTVVNQSCMRVFNHVFRSCDDQNGHGQSGEFRRFDVWLVHHQAEHFGVAFGFFVFFGEHFREAVADFDRPLVKGFHPAWKQVGTVKNQFFDSLRVF